MVRRVVAVIPARWGSQRFPGKPLAQIGGMPMIAHTVNRVKESRIGDVVVATDDKRIAQVAEGQGAQVVLTPTWCPTGTDRVLLASETLNLSASDIVVNIQGDEPFISAQHVSQLTEGMLDMSLKENRDFEMATLAVEHTGHIADQNIVKVVIDSAGDALYFSRAPIPFLVDDIKGPQKFLRHLGAYAFTFASLQQFCNLPKSFLEASESLEQLRALEAGHDIRVITVDGPCLPGIDTPEQLRTVEGLVFG